MTRPCTVLLLVSLVASRAPLLRAQDAPIPAQPTARRSSPSPDYPADVVKRGRDQFVKTCSFCHGPTATGTSNGPNLILSTFVRHDENGSQIGPIIRQGRTDKGMPAFNFTDAQIAEISTFLHSRMAASDLRSATRPMGDYSLDKLLTGKSEDGKAFFNGRGKCSTCHSPTGDLAGIARKYPPVTLQSRYLYPSEARLKATITDASGKQFTGAVKLLTNFDVAIVDPSGWYRSWPLSAVQLKLDDPLAAHRALLDSYTDADMHNIFAYLESLK
jgi:cytochrome c oxidase cbb3-type subunit 3